LGGAHPAREKAENISPRTEGNGRQAIRQVSVLQIEKSLGRALESDFQIGAALSGNGKKKFACVQKRADLTTQGI